MNPLKQLLYIFLCLFVGSLLKMVIPASIPATVYGMILLFLLFASKKVKPEDLDEASKPMLTYLAFLFIPSGVALIEQIEVLKGSLWQMLLAIILSTLLTVFVTGHVVQFFIRRKKGSVK